MAFELTEREHRWLTALLVLATIAAAFIVIGFVAGTLVFFGDVIMVFFLAWLLAFILSPIASGLMRIIPGLPRAIAVILVYVAIMVALILIVLQLAQALYSSIGSLVQSWPTIQDQLPGLLQPWQERLNSLGLGQVKLADQSGQILNNLQQAANNLRGPLQDLAFASIGVFGNVLFVVFLSLYMAVDRERILRFLFRLVPPGYSDEAKLLERSVSESFGGFLRGQALLGLLYGVIAALTSFILGLPYLPVTSAASGVLQAIPFFGPFLSWAPPVLVAIFFKPEAVVPTLVVMVAGWFILMNIVQPRLMADAVGLHPVVVLGSVLIGSKLAGVPGAIFGIPIAAVISAFFFYYLGQRKAGGPVAERAAQRVEAREGRRVIRPRLPQAGEDEDVEDSRPMASPRRSSGEPAAHPAQASEGGSAEP